MEVVCGDVVHDVEQGGDAGGVAGELGDFFVGEHDTADGVGGGEKHAAVSHEAWEIVSKVDLIGGAE